MSISVNRRDFLRVAAAGGGVAFASALPGWAAGRDADFFFVQLSDAHWGFSGPAVNPDAKGTLPKAIPAVNALLFIGVMAVMLIFGSSARLSTAYGISVTGALVVDSLLLLLVARPLWGWTVWKIVAAAVIFVPIAKRIGLGAVLGYLTAGVAIGPWMLGLIGGEGHHVMHFAEFGVVMMLFLVGLELRPSQIWQLRRPIFGLGGLQVVACAAVIATGAIAVGIPYKPAIAVGLTFAMSSTAIVLSSLAERGLLALPFTEADGGLAGSPLDLMVVAEALGRGVAAEP